MLARVLFTCIVVDTRWKRGRKNAVTSLTNEEERLGALVWRENANEGKGGGRERERETRFAPPTVERVRGVLNAKNWKRDKTKRCNVVSHLCPCLTRWWSLVVFRYFDGSFFFLSLSYRLYRLIKRVSYDLYTVRYLKRIFDRSGVLKWR